MQQFYDKSMCVVSRVHQDFAVYKRRLKSSGSLSAGLADLSRSDALPFDWTPV